MPAVDFMNFNIWVKRLALLMDRASEKDNLTALGIEGVCKAYGKVIRCLVEND